MNFSPSRPVPPDLRARIVAMLPLSNREDVAAAIGCHPATVSRIAADAGFRRPRGQPHNGTPTIWNAHKLTWPLTPRGQSPATWMQ